MKIVFPKLPFPAIQFPHFTRRFTVRLPVLPWKRINFLLISLVIAANLYEYRLFPVNEEKNLQLQILQNPDRSELHEKLGQYYLPISEEAAKREYVLAEELYQYSRSDSSNTLGVQSSPRQTWEAHEQQLEKLRGEVKYWQSINSSFPDYQYALLKLGALALQIGEKEKAAKYLQQVLFYSPQDKDATALLGKLN